jgi:nucleoside-diphosphate-sugar epimerase
MRALIGHTGFVGSNLIQFGRYDALFNSKNSGDLREERFDEVVCAGVSAVKWMANKEPEADWRGIASLIENLKHVKAKRFVLISTVDVYQKPIDVTEADLADDDGAAYGVHRAKLEHFVASTFENCLILRLPALFGRGLKKNAIFDLRHNNMVEAIDPRACFQWYDVRRLEKDMATISRAKISLMNIAAEPIPMAEIGERFFPGKLRKPDPSKPAARYDMKTRYANSLDGAGSYHFSRADVIESIGDYLRENL